MARHFIKETYLLLKSFNLRSRPLILHTVEADYSIFQRLLDLCALPLHCSRSLVLSKKGLVYTLGIPVFVVDAQGTCLVKLALIANRCHLCTLQVTTSQKMSLCMWRPGPKDSFLNNLTLVASRACVHVLNMTVASSS